MSYRSKLIVAFVALATATAALLFFGSTRSSQQALTNQIRNSVLSVAATAAGFVDADLHETIRNPEDLNSDAYATIEAKLREIRDANRREEMQAAFVYTMRKTGINPDVWEYVVDAEETGEDKSDIGEVIKWEGQYGEDDEPLRLGPAYADEKFVEDEYGYWLSAYAPIRDSAGNTVAMLGVDIEANDVIAHRQTLARSSFIALLIAIAAGAILSLLLARWAAQPLATITRSLRRIGDGHLEERAVLKRKDEFGQLATAVNEMAESIQERDALKGALSRMVSKEVAEKLIEEGGLPGMEGEHRVVTVLVSDIDNLSCLASRLEPARLLQLLNEYFEAMVDIVFGHGGTIDRLMGNRLIAVFGSPIDDPSKERHAVDAAIAMAAEIDRLNKQWHLDHESGFRLGLGIHTGDAVIGNVGAKRNIEFTVVGESVDIATMIEGLAPSHRARGLISGTTVEAISKDFSFLEVGDVQPEGFEQMLRLYTLSQLRLPARS